MDLKKAREVLNLLAIGLGIVAVISVLTDSTFWLLMMLCIAVVILFIATECLRCPHCRGRVRLNPDKFCPHCGKQLDT